MKLNLTTTMALVAAPLVLLGGVLVSTTTAGADQSRRCSNQTLYGSYGFAITGVILGPNLELRGLAMQRYDGHGNITQVDRIVENGIPREPEWTAGREGITSIRTAPDRRYITTPGKSIPDAAAFRRGQSGPGDRSGRGRERRYGGRQEGGLTYGLRSAVLRSTVYGLRSTVVCGSAL